MFTEISNILKEGEILQINIRKSGNELVVIVLPRLENVKDPAAEQLIPLNLKGLPEELDAGFIEAIKTPVEKSTTLISNLAEYEKSVEKAKNESKAVKDRQDLIDKHVKDGETFEKAGKNKEALSAYTKAFEMDRKNTKIHLKVNSLKLKLNGTHDIFSSATPQKEIQPTVEPETEEEDNSCYPDDVNPDDPYFE